MKYLFRFSLIFLIFFCCLFYNICYRIVEIYPTTIKKKYQIVCTTMLLADAMMNLAPHENFSVSALMGPGVDPHTYKARPSDIQTLLNADVIIYHGLHLEGKMGELLKELAQKKIVFCATDVIRKEQLITAGYDMMYDPHIWHDIQLWGIVINGLSQKLSQFFPEYESKLTLLCNQYKQILDETTIALDLLIKKIPEDRRILVTAHDAFHYFGARYLFTVFGLQGLSTESEIGIRDIHNLADLIVTKKIKAIFPESCISQRNILALQEVVEQKGGAVSTGGELFSDSLSTKEGNAGTYITMLLYNMTTIINALEKK